MKLDIDGRRLFLVTDRRERVNYFVVSLSCVGSSGLGLQIKWSKLALSTGSCYCVGGQDTVVLQGPSPLRRINWHCTLCYALDTRLTSSFILHSLTTFLFWKFFLFSSNWPYLFSFSWKYKNTGWTSLRRKLWYYCPWWNMETSQGYFS